LIEPIQVTSPKCRILVLTGYASIATTVDAIKLGADQYLAKPVDVDMIVQSLVSNELPDTESVQGDPLSVREIEWEHIQRILRENGGNISLAARLLRMHRRTLQRKLIKRPRRGMGSVDRDPSKP
jgi:two-component system response regulator RegA